MKFYQSEPNPFFPYTERNGIGVDKDVALLLSDPEIVLSPEEVVEAYSFAEGLYTGQVGEIECGTNKTLGEIFKTTSLSKKESFYLGYFQTDEGVKDLAKIGITPGVENTITSQLDDVSRINEEVDFKELKQVASNSLNWYKAQLSDCLLEDSDKDYLYVDVENIGVNYQPEKLLSKIEELQKFRNFYKKIYGSISVLDHLAEPKLALLEVYLGRVNNILVDLYPAAISLLEQIRRKPEDKQNRKWRQKLDEVLPAASQLISDRNNDIFTEQLKDSLARRLDLIKYGAGGWQNSYISPLSPEVIDLAENKSRKAETEPLIPREMVEVLGNTKWTADQIKEFGEDVLREIGLLSTEESTWQETEMRDGTATDNKWQVVVSPKKKSLSQIGKKKIIYIPENFDRTLIQIEPAGALPAFVHELTHAIQTEENDKLGKLIPLANIKGRRFNTAREFGAISQESEIQLTFGHIRPVNPHYAKAMKVKIEGGNKLEVARAFYNSYKENIDVNNEPELKKARELAVDRILRFYENQGYNSYPLDYLEQEFFKYCY